MFRAALLLAFAALGLAKPTQKHQNHARQLLGSSFGFPGPATFDYIVVGGGNAGLAVATRLAETGNNAVAVIEGGSFYEISNGNLSQVPAGDVYFAGKDANDTNSLVDWNFVTQPQAGANGRMSHYTRGKCLGGSSARNYMTYHLPTADSCQNWADAVNDQSYTFENFLPFYQKHQRFSPPRSNLRFANATPTYNASSLGTSGPVSVTYVNYAEAFGTYIAKGLQQLGMAAIDGFTNGKLIGSAYSIKTISAENMTRDASETAYLSPVLSTTPNLIVYQSTLAKTILFNSNKTVTGVKVSSAGQEYTLTARKEIVISAGAFQSPQLLMVSGVGPAAALKQHNIPVVADRPGVGANMQDHILFGPAYRINVITGSSIGIPAFAAEAGKQFNSKPPTGILTNPGDDVLGWEKVPRDVGNFSAKALADLAKFPSDWPEIEFLPVGGFFGYQNNFVKDAPKDGYNYATVATALVAPLSRGSVNISSADTSDLPLINPNWLTDSTDVEVAIAAFKRARQLWTSEALKPILIGDEYFPGSQVQTDAEILALIRKAMNTVFHAACTCAMGAATDPNAVVDSRARVIGVSGLRVVDASAFPFLPPGHPQSTVYALAEKISDDILNNK